MNDNEKDLNRTVDANAEPVEEEEDVKIYRPNADEDNVRIYRPVDNTVYDAASEPENEVDEEPEEEEDITLKKHERPAHAKHFSDKDQRIKEKNAKKLEKLIKKQKRKEKHSNREVLSYEDMPLEEPQESDLPPKKSNKKVHVKRIIAVAVIIALLFTIVLVVFNTDKLTWHNITNFVEFGVLNRRADETFPLDNRGVTVSAGNFVRFGQDICYSSDTKTQLLNNYGRTEFSHQHAFINPVLTVGKKGALVYNLGGTGYQIISKDGSVYNGKAENNILLADYGSNGSYAVVTESSGYLSKLYVYNEKHAQIFAYSFADYYVTSVSLNSSGKRAVVSGVSALNGVEIASIYVLDFTKDTPLYFSESENNIIYKIQYLNDKFACAIGRSASYLINTSTGEIKTKDYEGRELTAFDINTGTRTYTLSLSGSGDGRNCDIISYGVSGVKEKSFSVEEKVIDLSTYKGRVALLTSEKILLFSKDGRSISEEELSSDPHRVVLYTTSDAYVLCTGYIDVVKL